MGRPPSFDEQAVVDAAIAVFTEQGYAGTDAATLCARTGIARSSFYNTFGSLDSLFQRALADYAATGRPAREELLTSTDPAPVLIRRRLRDSLEPQCADPDRAGCLSVNTVVELGRSIESVSAILDADRQAWLGAYAMIIRRGQDARHLRPELEPHTTAALVHSTLAGFRVAARIVSVDEVRAQLDAFLGLLCTPAGNAALTAHQPGKPSS